MINPFTANVNKGDASFQEELLKIRHDEESKTNFDSGGYIQLWQNQKVPNIYISIYFYKFLITFPISYLVKVGLRAVNQILAKRNASKICERWDIHLMLSKSSQAFGI